MKHARNRLVLGAVLLAFGAVAASLFVQAREQQRAAEAHIAAQRAADEARSRTGKPESVEVPPAEAREPVEAAGSERTQAGTSMLELLVVDPAGLPVGAAAIAIFRGEEVLESGRSDAHGRIHFEAREGAGEYAIAARGWDVARGACELGAGSQTLALAEGALAGGTVLVDGAAPRAEIELSWTPKDRRAGIGSLPQQVQRALVQAYGSGVLPVVRTGPRGEFAFRGLPASDPGLIRWSGPLFLEGDRNESWSRQIDVPAPRGDLVLRLTAGFDVRLRVVDPFGAPVPRGQVTITHVKSTPLGPHMTGIALGAAADREGRYAQPMTATPFEKLLIKVAANEGAGIREYEFAASQRTGSVWDLGDLAIDAARELTVLVQDPEARAIPKAEVTMWPAPKRRPDKRTDAQGRITISIGEGDKEIAARAFGFQSARFPIPPDASDVVATLQPCCMLEFEVPGYTGELDALQLEISGPSPLFVDEIGDEPDTPKTEGGHASMMSDFVTTTFTAKPLQPGFWRVAGIRPGVPMRVRLRGAGQPVWTDVPPLAPGEVRRVALSTAPRAPPLRVRVVGPAGEPIPTAVVLTVQRGPMTTWQEHAVDKQGEVELDSLFGESCDLEVRAPAFPPKPLLLQPIPRGTYVITLDAPRSVEVEVVLNDGTPCTETATVQTGRAGPSVVKAKSLGSGRYLLEGLPTGEISILVNGPCGWKQLLHDTSVDSVRVQVGDKGHIEATVLELRGGNVALLRFGFAVAGSPRDLCRDSLVPNSDGTASASAGGLADGSYDVWLEVRAETVEESWKRVGKAVAVVIDAEHRSVQVELDAPPP